MSGHMQCDLDLGTIIDQSLLWFLLSLITLGIDLMFAPYPFSKLVLRPSTCAAGYY